MSSKEIIQDQLSIIAKLEQCLIEKCEVDPNNEERLKISDIPLYSQSTFDLKRPLFERGWLNLKSYVDTPLSQCMHHFFPNQTVSEEEKWKVYHQLTQLIQKLDQRERLVHARRCNGIKEEYDTEVPVFVEHLPLNYVLYVKRAIVALQCGLPLVANSDVLSAMKAVDTYLINRERLIPHVVTRANVDEIINNLYRPPKGVNLHMLHLITLTVLQSGTLFGRPSLLGMLADVIACEGKFVEPIRIDTALRYFGIAETENSTGTVSTADTETAAESIGAESNRTNVAECMKCLLQPFLEKAQTMRNKDTSCIAGFVEQVLADKNGAFDQHYLIDPLCRVGVDEAEDRFLIAALMCSIFAKSIAKSRVIDTKNYLEEVFNNKPGVNSQLKECAMRTMIEVYKSIVPITENPLALLLMNFYFNLHKEVIESTCLEDHIKRGAEEVRHLLLDMYCSRLLNEGGHAVDYEDRETQGILERGELAVNQAKQAGWHLESYYLPMTYRGGPGGDRDPKNVLSTLKRLRKNVMSAVRVEVDALKGFKLVAKRAIREGESFLVEKPFALFDGHAKHENASACAYCHESIASSNPNDISYKLHQQMQQISGGQAGSFLNLGGGGSSSASRCSCPGCGECYCSEQCKTQAFDKYHKKLCVSTPTGKQWQGFIDELNQLPDAFSGLPSNACLAVKVMVMAECQGLHSPFDLPEIKVLYCPFDSREPIDTSASTGPPLLDWDRAAKIRRIFADRLSRNYPALLSHHVTMTEFIRLHALLSRNVIGGGTRAAGLSGQEDGGGESLEDAFAAFLSSSQGGIGNNVTLNGKKITPKAPSSSSSSSKKKATKTETKGMVETTIYLAASFANHSCDPNTEYKQEFAMQNLSNGPIPFLMLNANVKNSDITFRAKRNIAAGEEITITYIDTDRPYKERQANLLYGYGIRSCDCKKCVKERKREFRR